MRLTDTMTSVAMFLGDNGEAELSRKLFAEIQQLQAAEREPMACTHPKACLVEREVSNIEKNEGPLSDTEYCSACAPPPRERGQ